MLISFGNVNILWYAKGVWGTFRAEVFRCEIHFQMVWQKESMYVCVDEVPGSY